MVAVAFSADGRRLVSGGVDRTVRLWDVEAGKELRPAGGHQGTVTALAPSPDGRVLATASEDGSVLLWDPATGRELRRLAKGLGPVRSAAWLPDGKTLLAAAGRGIWLWDAHTGREVRRLRLPDSGELALAPDGKRAVRGSDSVRLVDVATGNVVAQLGLQFEGRWPAAFSPDGKLVTTAASPHERKTPLLLWHGATGKLLRRFTGEGLWGDQENRIRVLAATPDGRLLVGGCKDGTVRLWEWATGQQRAAYWLGDHPLNAVAVSPDGRFVVSGGEDGRVRVRDLVAGTEVLHRKGHRGRVTAVAFLPDNRVLSAGADATVLVWGSPSPAAVSGPADLSADELDGAWETLLREDAAPAGRALRRLLGAPGPSVAFLRERLRPVAPLKPDLLKRLIADLNSDRFATRQGAEKELAKLGRLAEPALRQATASSPNEEVRRRAEALLARLPADRLSAEEVRVLRAVEVLEYAGTAEARRLLEELAGGAPGALRTVWARAALERLRRAGR